MRGRLRHQRRLFQFCLLVAVATIATVFLQFTPFLHFTPAERPSSRQMSDTLCRVRLDEGLTGQDDVCGKRKSCKCGIIAIAGKPIGAMGKLRAAEWSLEKQSLKSDDLPVVPGHGDDRDGLGADRNVGTAAASAALISAIGSTIVRNRRRS